MRERYQFFIGIFEMPKFLIFLIATHLVKMWTYIIAVRNVDILSRSKSPQFSSHGLLPVGFLFGAKKKRSILCGVQYY